MINANSDIFFRMIRNGARMDVTLSDMPVMRIDLFSKYMPLGYKAVSYGRVVIQAIKHGVCESSTDVY